MNKSICTLILLLFATFSSYGQTTKHNYGTIYHGLTVTDNHGVVHGPSADRPKASFRYNGFDYNGEYIEKNGKKIPDGWGEMYPNYEPQYIGEWKNGKYHGWGHLNRGVDTFIGEFKNGKPHGYCTAIGGTQIVTGKTKDYWDFTTKYTETETPRQGSFRWDNGSYTGGFGIEHGREAPYGQGEITYDNGDKYSGGWIYGKFHGQGKYTFADGATFEGEFEWDKCWLGDYTPAKGYGERCSWDKAKERHEKEAAKNKEAGISRGKKKFDDGIYEGDLKDGVPHGQGTFTLANGNKYIGEFKEGSVTGQGTLTFPSGEKYVGQFKNANFDGQGKITFTDGSTFEGVFEGGNCNRGKFRSAQGNNKECSFAEAQQSIGQNATKAQQAGISRGKMEYAGGVYEGDLKDGVPHGQGTLTLANGTKYVGEFKDGVPHGQGTLTHVDGTKYVGKFKDGKFNGQGTSTDANGNKYVGEFKDGEPHGQGTFTDVNGTKYVGEFKDGMPINGIYYDKNGKEINRIGQ